MSKPKSNSVLDALPENQRQQLEAWLFEENVSYAKASERLLSDFNVRCAPSSLGEWYQRIAQKRIEERMLANIAFGSNMTQAASKAFQQSAAPNLETAMNYFRVVQMKMMTGVQPSLKEIQVCNEMMGKLLDYESGKTKAALEQKKLSLSEKRILLDVEKFQFDAAKKALLEAAKIKSIAAKPGLQEKEKINQVRLALFGSAPE